MLIGLSKAVFIVGGIWWSQGPCDVTHAQCGFMSNYSFILFFSLYCCFFPLYLFPDSFVFFILFFLCYWYSLLCSFFVLPLFSSLVLFFLLLSLFSSYIFYVLYFLFTTSTARNDNSRWNESWCQVILNVSFLSKRISPITTKQLNNTTVAYVDIDFDKVTDVHRSLIYF